MEGMNQFLKKIGPVGSGIFLVVFILFFVLCFTESRDELKGYEPPHDSGYYLRHPAELAQEIEMNVAPKLPGVEKVAYQPDDGKVVVHIEEDRFYPVQRALYRHFDRDLLILEKLEEKP